MKRVLIVLLTMLMSSSCSAQEENKESVQAEKNTDNVAESTEPKVSWKVNKETDEYGNVVRYDSIYTWSYSNVDGVHREIDVDSLMKQFDGFMEDRMPVMWNDQLWQPFEKDSLWRRDFWGDEFYQDRWRRDFYHFDQMFKRMDSLREHFLRERFPDRQIESKEIQKI